jgi:hypothetical protein
MGFYDEMQEMATELLAPEASGGLGQGSVTLKRITPGTPNADQPWLPVAPTTESWALGASVRRQHYRYVSGTLVAETGDIVVFSTPSGVTPMLSDQLIIDGSAREMSELTPIPGAGTVVAWKAWCKA